MRQCSGKGNLKRSCVLFKWIKDTCFFVEFHNAMGKKHSRRKYQNWTMCIGQRWTLGLWWRRRSGAAMAGSSSMEIFFFGQKLNLKLNYTIFWITGGNNVRSTPSHTTQKLRTSTSISDLTTQWNESTIAGLIDKSETKQPFIVAFTMLYHFKFIFFKNQFNKLVII